MNFGELLTELKDLLNFDSAQTHQDFTDTQLKSALNRAYLREIRKARQQGLDEYFLDTTTFTWTSGEQTYALVDPLNKASILQLRDVTDSEYAQNMAFTESFRWLDRNTLEWLPDGPSSDRTIRAFFSELPVDMVSNNEEPDLIPREFREVLVYSAAVELRLRADEEAPRSWEGFLDDVRADYWKHLSLGRPRTNQASISLPSNVDDLTGYNSN